MNNSSSHNYLMESNSQFFKDKLNSNFINASNEIITKNKENKDIKKDENENQENYQELILKKSNITFVIMIKVCVIIIVLLILLIFIFILCKIYYTNQHNKSFNTFFHDFNIISNRYTIIYYYFNTFRTLLIFPEDERKTKLELVWKEIDLYYIEHNREFIKLFSQNKNIYIKTIKFYNFIMESKNNSTELIKINICKDKAACLKYFNNFNNNNIFDSGIDLVYKASINDIKNLYMDYINLKNKTDINEINFTLINTKSSEFINIGLSLGNVFLFVNEELYNNFEIDVLGYNDLFSKNMNVLNIISIVFTLLLFLFLVFYMFIFIWRFTEPIKEACYRINCSFYYIKIYSLTSYKRTNNIL